MEARGRVFVDLHESTIEVKKYRIGVYIEIKSHSGEEYLILEFSKEEAKSIGAELIRLAE
jgi:hypothetical protein